MLLVLLFVAIMYFGEFFKHDEILRERQQEKNLCFIYKERLITVDQLFLLNWVAFLNSNFPPTTNRKGLNFLYSYLDASSDRYFKLIIRLLSMSIFARQNNLIQTFLCALMFVLQIH